MCGQNQNRLPGSLPDMDGQFLSRHVSNVSLVMAMFVVTVHICSLEEEANPWIAFVHGIARCPVPFFFVISGFFAGKHFEDSGWWRQAVMSRARTLLVPAIITVILAFLWSIPFIVVANFLAGRPLAQSIPWVNGLVPGIGPLWYVRCLFVLVVLTPVFKWVIGKLGWLWLVIAGIVYLFLEFSFVPNESVHPWLAFLVGDLGILSPSGLFYFSVGLWCKMYEIRIDRINAKWSLPVGLILLGARGWSSCHVVADMEHVLTVVSIPFVFTGIWSVLRVLNELTFYKDSFPLYLIHMSIAIPVGIIAKRLFSQGGFASFFFKWAVVVVLSLFMIKLIRKLLPRFAHMWFGGR